VIRALLVPSIMAVAGRWNWWLPQPLARALLVRARPPAAALEKAGG
jgi:putative drug exporter of the RND superfamily